LSNGNVCHVLGGLGSQIPDARIQWSMHRGIMIWRIAMGLICIPSVIAIDIGLFYFLQMKVRSAIRVTAFPWRYKTATPGDCVDNQLAK